MTNDGAGSLGEPPDRGRMIALLERPAEPDTENPPGREVEAARFLADDEQSAPT